LDHQRSGGDQHQTRLDIVFFEKPSLLRHPQTGKNSTRAAVTDGQPVFGSYRGNEHEDQNNTQDDREALFHSIAFSIVPDHNAALGQMPERLKQTPIMNYLR
jgi:hypothetical protein